MSFWFKTGSDAVRIEQLERRLVALEDRFTKVTREVLEATETLDRVTKRAFRLTQQTKALEAENNEKNTDSSPEAQRAALLRKVR